MSNELKNKLLKFKGTVSQEEVDYIQKMLPNNNYSLSNFSGTISDREKEFLKNNIPNLKKRYK